MPERQLPKSQAGDRSRHASTKRPASVGSLSMAFAGTREPAQTTSRSSPGRRPPRPLFWLSLWWCTASSPPRLVSSVIRSGPNANVPAGTVAWLRGLAIASQRGAAKRHASCFNFYTRLRHGSTGATLGPAHLQTRQRCAGPPQLADASFCRARRIAGRPFPPWFLRGRTKFHWTRSSRQNAFFETVFRHERKSSYETRRRQRLGRQAA